MKLRRLDPHTLLLGEHSYLDATDECYFMGSYQCRRRTGFKPVILALKRGYGPAVSSLAEHLGRALPSDWALTYTFVPIPSSSGTVGGVKLMVNQLPVCDKRELILQDGQTPASHNGWRLTPRQRQDLLVLNELVVEPPPQGVVIVDDVLATGAHFRASKSVIHSRWGHVRVIGLFIGRACFHWSACRPDSPVCRAGVESSISVRGEPASK